jgi:hypothetical protein
MMSQICGPRDLFHVERSHHFVRIGLDRRTKAFLLLLSLADDDRALYLAPSVVLHGTVRQCL